MTMQRLRVLVVEDSVTVRKRLCEVLAADDDLEVVGEATDGHEAIAMCIALKPDVITMDMMLPTVTGLAATEYIMAHCPTPILVVSSSSNRGEMFRMFDALTAGAVDALEKPDGEDDEDWPMRLVSSVKLVARIRVITHLRGKIGGAPVAKARHKPLAASNARVNCQLIAIGASTGGPGALVHILNAMVAALPVPVLVVQHIGEDFGTAFVEWLNLQVPQKISYGQEGQALCHLAGHVLLAPPGRHMLVQHGRLQLSSGPMRHSCRPSIDILFESIARECAASTVACLLTGMGRDGAAGLLDIRQAGGHTIAQDEASSTIYGMPREAVRLDAAAQVLPLQDIGPALTSMYTNEQKVQS
ncbi:MAG: chemotaxis-specific protein-glutamate methyltransferase CheB [Aquabacterium sp.]